MKTDPPRLVHVAIDLAKSDLPSADALAKMSRNLPFGPIGGGPGGGSGGGGAGPLKALGGLSPVLSGALLGGALGIVALGALAIVSATKDTAGTPSIAAVSIAPESSAIPVPRAIVPHDEPFAKRAAVPTPPKDSREPAPATPATSPVAAVDEAPAPSSTVAITNETESALLSRAQEALAGDPARALALCDEHAARFPGGLLGQEREIIAITALLARGDKELAHARGARLVSAFPRSAYRRRLEVLLPDLENDGEDHKSPSARPSTP